MDASVLSESPAADCGCASVAEGCRGGAASACRTDTKENAATATNAGRVFLGECFVVLIELPIELFITAPPSRRARVAAGSAACRSKSPSSGLPSLKSKSPGLQQLRAQSPIPLRN